MQNEIDVIKDVSQKLLANQIPFMITGSIAMNYYATPRMTRDIDIVTFIQIKDIPLIYSLFKDDYYIDENAIQLAIDYNKMFNIIHNKTITKVDFIIRKTTEYRMIEFERRQEVDLFGISTYIASKEDLILSKLEWMKLSDSEQQKRDIQTLLLLDYDKKYVEEWCMKLKLLDSLRKVHNG